MLELRRLSVEQRHAQVGNHVVEGAAVRRELGEHAEQPGREPADDLNHADMHIRYGTMQAFIAAGHSSVAALSGALAPTHAEEIRWRAAATPAEAYFDPEQGTVTYARATR